MNRFRIRDSSAASLAVIALTAKVFSGVILDSPTLYNSRWIAALIGGIIALPAALSADRIRQKYAAPPLSGLRPCILLPVSAALAVIFAFDAAITAVSIAASASYIAVSNVTTFYLLLPQFALCVWCLSFNGNAIGSAGRLLGQLLLAVIAIAAVFALPKYRPNWLTPLLGPGVSTLAAGALRCAGWYSMLIPIFLLAESDPERKPVRFRAARSLCAATVLSVALLVLHSMLSPALLTGDEATRLSRMDALLSNGRLPLGMQLPMIVLWLVSLFFLLLFDAWLCAAMVQTAAPRLKKAMHILIAVLLIIVLSFSGQANQYWNRVSGLLYFPLSLLLLIFCAWNHARRKGGSNHV